MQSLWLRKFPRVERNLRKIILSKDYYKILRSLFVVEHRFTTSLIEDQVFESFRLIFLRFHQIVFGTFRRSCNLRVYRSNRNPKTCFLSLFNELLIEISICWVFHVFREELNIFIHPSFIFINKFIAVFRNFNDFFL